MSKSRGLARLFKIKNIKPVVTKVINFLNFKLTQFQELLISTKFPLLLELLKWKLVDICRLFTKGKKLHIYGIWCYVGIYGGGKTISLVETLERMREKHGDNILIATNFYYKGQDFEIKTWKDLLPEYGKPVIFAYDELQNEFNSREYKSFPTSLMVLLTQNRKGNGKQIIYTTQDYETVDKNFRRLTQKVVTCRTLFGRLVHTRYYNREIYDNLISQVDVKLRMKLRPYMSKWYVQSDYLRNQYDSFQMLASAKDKQYMDRVVESLA